ncbi:cysteine hydrolase family protein [Niallia sp. Sow4_A1]|uniref:Isochorismatase family cysteine hydrolase n=1 Tax=Niallia hominis TaxID=3133173 RepID=A0ABV1EWL1_9BACI|nr:MULTISPECIES: isochorismatase family cysteine hydrolase [Bacillaceae]MCF2647420.1 cysteine hydrolase [Niallia circulans]MCM3365049.1 cysteine hydrolase [Niallia sp. MER TA 168]CAI9385998.1 Nicotinamidase/pyrazinamidase [Bacillus sp. T2.9-1]
MKALINIDYTFDFVEGNLPCGIPGIAIEKEIVSITERFIENGDYTVFAIDLHTLNDNYHPESKLFPPHNIAGTKGRELYGALQKTYENNKELTNVYWIDKTRYSAFAGTDLHIKLQERSIKDIYLVGVCTDICVLHTAVDAYNHGYNIHIYENAVATFNEIGHQWALEHFKNVLGARIL